MSSSLVSVTPSTSRTANDPIADPTETARSALPDLTAGNRKFAVAGLLRTPDRSLALLDAVSKGVAKAEWLTPEQRTALLKHADEKVRRRAGEVLGR